MRCRSDCHRRGHRPHADAPPAWQNTSYLSIRSQDESRDDVFSSFGMTFYDPPIIPASTAGRPQEGPCAPPDCDLEPATARGPHLRRGETMGAAVPDRALIALRPAPSPCSAQRPADRSRRGLPCDRNRRSAVNQTKPPETTLGLNERETRRPRSRQRPCGLTDPPPAGRGRDGHPAMLPQRT
jgi:hypothetical protein